MVTLAAFWFLYFIGLGIFFPFFALYLHDTAGLDGSEVGLVFAVVPLVGMLTQPLWGQLADRSGRRVAVLATTTGLSALAYAALGALSTFWQFVAGTAVLSLFAWAVIPLAISVTLGAVRDAGPNAFGLVRVWGTIGYLLGVAVFPWLLDRWGGGTANLHLMFPAAGLCAGAAALLGLALPRGGAVATRAHRGEWRVLLRDPAVLRLLGFLLLAYFFLQGPTSLFAIFVQERGGDVGTVGRMWVVMLLVEIPLVALSGAGLRRLGGRGLLAVGVLGGGLRWLACALTDDMAIVYAAQVLHGVVVVGLLLGGPLYLELFAPEPLRSTGQALVAMAGPGLGSILSNAAAGWVLEAAGADALLLLGGLGGVLMGLSVGWILPPGEARRPRDPVIA